MPNVPVFAIFVFINNCIKNIFVHKALATFTAFPQDDFPNMILFCQRCEPLKTLDKHTAHLFTPLSTVCSGFRERSVAIYFSSPGLY